MTPDGYIIEQSHLNPFTGESEAVSVRWEGGPLARMDYRHARRWAGDVPLRAGKALGVGPYRAILLEEEMLGRVWLVLRDDGPLSRLRFYAHHATRWLDLAYRRLIVTAAVWGLADYQDTHGYYRLPTWRDVRALRKTEEKLRKMLGKGEVER